MTTSKPCDYNILTYCVPWVPADVDEDQVHQILRSFWEKTIAGVSLTARIEFVEIPYNNGMKQAFVYHYPCAIAKTVTNIIETGMREKPSYDLAPPRAYYGEGRDKRHLLILTNKTPTSAVLRMMAEIENEEESSVRSMEDNARWLTAWGDYGYDDEQESENGRTTPEHNDNRG
jgi:hypothetical protein